MAPLSPHLHPASCCAIVLLLPPHTLCWVFGMAAMRKEAVCSGASRERWWLTLISAFSEPFLDASHVVLHIGMEATALAAADVEVPVAEGVGTVEAVSALAFCLRVVLVPRMVIPINDNQGRSIYIS
uniref:Secreted protein n=1 Tax=Oryza sativa subsp. japonica TaxID=39947 RepID=Q67WZ3_ORYSJ|nr:hypothetical protein [Oryza sativa Japonica Group]